VGLFRVYKLIIKDFRQSLYWEILIMDCIKNIEGIKPKAFWKNFDKILSIPHPSGHEQQLVEYLKDFSENLGLAYTVDRVGNLLIRKTGSAGKKNAPGVVLQAHLDMVPQKNQGTEHDFLTDPITAYAENGWVKANGTTLGADNGTGIASIMSILEDDSIEHGPIEALLTVEEEVGLRGAGNLKPGELTGKYMINLDGGPGEVFVIGCAGGVNSDIIFNYDSEKVVDAENKNFIKLTVKGLKGGHSGGDVQKQLGNANKILFRILYKLNKECEIGISDIDSGGLRNAIPREGSLVFGFDKAKEKEIIEKINIELDLIKTELQNSDSGLYIEIENVKTPANIIDKKTQDGLIAALHIAHNGLIRIFDETPEFVQTSTNLASVKLNSDTQTVKVLFMTRSAVLSLKNEFCDKIEALFKMAGASKVEQHGTYPGWTPNTESKLLNTAVDLNKEIFEKKPKLTITHGGLECGIIGSVYPEMEMLAIGPNIKGAHSPDERLEIISMERNYNFLVKLLAKL
jgi:dipeptidase D